MPCLARAAQYVLAGHVSEKTDTFAFGVVLCELLTGKAPADYEQGECLAAVMYGALEATAIVGTLPEMLDTSVNSSGAGGGWQLVKALQLGGLAKRCIDIHVRSRCTVIDIAPDIDALAERLLPTCTSCGEVLPPHATNAFCTFCGHQQ